MDELVLPLKFSATSKSNDAEMKVRLPSQLKDRFVTVAKRENLSMNELVILLIQQQCELHNMGASYDYIFSGMKPKTAWKTSVLRFMENGHKYSEAYIRFWGSVISIPSEQVYHIYMKELESQKLLERVLPQPSFEPKQWIYTGPVQPEVGIIEKEFWRPYIEQYTKKKAFIRSEQEKGGTGIIFVDHTQTTGRGMGRSEETENICIP